MLVYQAAFSFCGFLVMRAIYFFVFFRIVSPVSSFEAKAEAVYLKCEPITALNHTVKEIVHKVQNCSRKIRITISLKNSDKSPETLSYFFVGSVTDSESGIKLKLLNSLLVQFKQEQILLAYPLKYLTAVTARASEAIINYENQKNFTGCDDESLINPTCGYQHEKGIAVDYSQGFCCFCPESPTKGKQARGGQDCSLTRPPSDNINLISYKASAHCLRKSKIWYTVNALGKPDIMHQVFIQVYIQKYLLNGTIVWVALTGDEDYTIGTQEPYEFNDNKTLVLTYVTEKPLDSSISIKFEENRLLVPQPLLSGEVEEPVSKGATDYLMINRNLINSDGDVCDKAGVSYEAFSLQSDRCDIPRNSCLKNQPLDFWEKDNAIRKSGGKGIYLLQNYGTPYKDPILINKETKEHWLVLEYYKPHKSFIYVETSADDILVLHVGKFAQILNIISSSTSSVIIYNINIQNSGLVSAEFTVSIVDCGYSVPNSKPQTLVVSPQLQSSYVASTKFGDIQLSEPFTCMVEVRSPQYGVVAKREVKIKPKKRCICNFHCQCVDLQKHHLVLLGTLMIKAWIEFFTVIKAKNIILKDSLPPQFFMMMTVTFWILQQINDGRNLVHVGFF